MVRSKLAMGFVVGLFWIAVSVPSGAVAADDAAPPGLDNTACLSCHDGEHGDLEVPAADDETRTLTPVEPGAFANSVHADMDCVACHRDITRTDESGVGKECVRTGRLRWEPYH